jgi:hypothetical protein
LPCKTLHRSFENRTSGDREVLTIQSGIKGAPPAHAFPDEHLTLCDLRSFIEAINWQPAPVN